MRPLPDEEAPAGASGRSFQGSRPFAFIHDTEEIRIKQASFRATETFSRHRRCSEYGFPDTPEPACRSDFAAMPRTELHATQWENKLEQRSEQRTESIRSFQNRSMHAIT